MSEEPALTRLRRCDWHRGVSIALQVGLAMVIMAFCCVRGQSYRLVDLTHPFSPDTISWPGNPDFKMDILHRGQTEGEFW